MQIGKRQRQGIGIGARQTGATEHQIDVEARDIGHQPLPQKLHGAGAGAIAFQHAGAAQLQEFGAGRQAVQHGCDVIFAGGIEAAGPRRVLLARQAIGGDHQRLAILAMRLAVHHQKMVADIVILVEIAAGLAHLGRGDRAHLFVEDAVTKPLRLFDLVVGLGQAHFQRARDGQDWPLLGAAFKRPGFVNIDHAIPFSDALAENGIGRFCDRFII